MLLLRVEVPSFNMRWECELGYTDVDFAGWVRRMRGGDGVEDGDVDDWKGVQESREIIEGSC